MGTPRGKRCGRFGMHYRSNGDVLDDNCPERISDKMHEDCDAYVFPREWYACQPVDLNLNRICSICLADLDNDMHLKVRLPPPTTATATATATSICECGANQT